MGPGERIPKGEEEGLASKPTRSVSNGRGTPSSIGMSRLFNLGSHEGAPKCARIGPRAPEWERPSSFNN